MKVFISWSGDPSCEIAGIIRKYLPYIVHGVTAFMSQHDLESGIRWSLELATNLEEADFGIICMTPENQNSPWLLFEAGALTKHIQGRACCLLFSGLKPANVVGPLAQFQNRVFTKKELRALVRDINGKLPEPLQDQMLDDTFEKWWPDVEKEVENAIKASTVTQRKAIKRDAQDVLEEILLKVRGVEQSFEELRRSSAEGKQSEASLIKSCPSCGGSLKPALIAQYSGDGAFLHESGFQCSDSTCSKCFLIQRRGSKTTLIEVEPVRAAGA